MPSVSKKQHNFMAAIAKNPSFAKKVGIKPSVGEEFLKADKGKTFKQGGEMKESKEMMKKEVAFMKKKGAPKSMLKHEMAEAKGMKMGGVAKKVTKEMEYDYKTGKKSFAGSTAKRDAHAEKEGKIVAKHAAYDKSMGMKKGGMAECKTIAKKEVKGHEKRMHGMARGGGIEIKGKTKGTMIKMCGGGMSKKAK
jgi:hypothetical protein